MKINPLPPKKLVRSLVITLAVAIVVNLLFVSGILNRLEWISFDQRAKIFRSDKSAPDDIAIVMIDQSSLNLMNDRLGRFPWPRAIYGDLLDFLALGEPRAVIFDILFVENQRETALNKGRRQARLNPNDQRLVNASKKYPFVYHAMEILEEAVDADGLALKTRPLPNDFVRRFGLEVPPALVNEDYNRIDTAPRLTSYTRRLPASVL